MPLDVYESICFNQGMMIDYCTLYFKTGLIDLELDSKSQECEKAKTSTPIISQTFQLIWIEFGMLLRLVDVMNLILVLSHQISIQGHRVMGKLEHVLSYLL